MLRTLLACTALAATAVATPSFAQDAERYQIERTQNGYIRLDTQTGRTSLCEERGERLVCRMATEEREAHDRDLDALLDKIETLEARVAALEERQPAASLPSEEEFEQTLGYMERFLRRFMGIVTDMERRPGADDPEPPADRT